MAADRHLNRKRSVSTIGRRLRLAAGPAEFPCAEQDCPRSSQQGAGALDLTVALRRQSGVEPVLDLGVDRLLDPGVDFNRLALRAER